jgi:hypothetical protein
LAIRVKHGWWCLSWSELPTTASQARHLRSCLAHSPVYPITRLPVYPISRITELRTRFPCGKLFWLANTCESTTNARTQHGTCEETTYIAPRRTGGRNGVTVARGKARRGCAGSTGPLDSFPPGSGATRA